ncbi:MAG: hypothetical protein WC279_12575 [Sulfurimonas sp.]|uniref:hypothetical protein n=1 Tax=Sulfurimonas sp. TaxID=2022749 RepID=UPI00356A1538
MMYTPYFTKRIEELEKRMDEIHEEMEGMGKGPDRDKFSKEFFDIMNQIQGMEGEEQF